MWKWCKDNGKLWKPDWLDKNPKYVVHYEHQTGEWLCDNYVSEQIPNQLPVFKSVEDCEEFIKANESHLSILLK